jgi:group I intron endonuclease
MIDMGKHYIYVVENTINNKYYIGQTKEPSIREKRHLRGDSCSKLLNRAVVKYGAEKFEFVLLEVCADQEVTDLREIYWIEQLGTLAPPGYNLSKGGGGISGYRFSLEQRLNLSRALKGLKRSEETRDKISRSKRGRKNPMYGRSGIDSPTFGRKHSEATREKLRQLSLGRRHSEETKEKLRVLSGGTNNPMFGKKHSEETRRKMRERWKKRKIKQELPE